MMTTVNRTVLVTGANRGLGRALLEEALPCGAAATLERHNAYVQAGATTP